MSEILYFKVEPTSTPQKITELDFTTMSIYAFDKLAFPEFG